MDRYDKVTALWMVAAFAVITVSYIAVIVTAAYFEASAYNRITGSNVSTWDAIFLEFRVQADPDEK